MALEVFQYRIEGVSSLLMHSPDAMHNNASSGATVKRIPSPEEESEAGTYRDEDGFLYLPSLAFRSSLLHGAGGRRFGRTSARTVLAGAVFNTTSQTTLLDPESGEKLKYYKINVSRVVVRGAGVMRARPELERWSCVLELEIDMDFNVQPWMVEELLNIAGRVSGVGDFRPERKGPHGRYRAVLIGNGA